MSLHDFPPDPARASFLDARMHGELAASLSHIAGALAEAGHPAASPLHAAAGQIASGRRVGPATFARYFQIGERVLDGTEASLAGLTGAARALLADTEAGRAPFAVLARGHAGPLDALLDERMGEEAQGFAPVTPDEAAAFATRLEEGLALMQAALPALHGEVTAIVRTALAATAPEGATMQFDGASHYQFWGLLLLNPRFHQTRLAMVEVLAHESAHSLLFGLTVEEPLVRNPDDALYPSPLRADPRPMDGIYHATFVSARMAWAMEALAASGQLTAEESRSALEAAEADRANFAAGLSVVDAQGQLSPTGAAILDAARAWISAPRP